MSKTETALKNAVEFFEKKSANFANEMQEPYVLFDAYDYQVNEDFIKDFNEKTKSLKILAVDMKDIDLESFPEMAEDAAYACLGAYEKAGGVVPRSYSGPYKGDYESDVHSWCEFTKQHLLTNLTNHGVEYELDHYDDYNGKYEASDYYFLYYCGNAILEDLEFEQFSDDYVEMFLQISKKIMKKDKKNEKAKTRNKTLA